MKWVAVIIGIGVLAAPFGFAESCSSAIKNGEDCTGLAESFDDSEGLQYFVALIGAGIAIGGYALLGRIEDDWQLKGSTRPCPRCGRSVTKGVLDCPHCEFDFRTIGASPNAAEVPEDRAPSRSTSLPPDADGALECADCGARFKDIEDLAAHRERLHP